MNYAVETFKLGRTFKLKKEKGKTPSPITALDDVNLTVKCGELFGVLGPNGAGKTTLIKILATLLLPSSGTALVGGIDVVKRPEEVRKLINMVSGGEHSGYGILTVQETLWMFSQFYGISTKTVLERINALAKLLDMEKYLKTKISKLSTGMRQKLNIMRGFVCDPKILFLDEPTLGLDVQISREVRKYIKKWVEENQERTVLLTTHYMAEADELCDRVAIIDQGKVLVCDTPGNLKKLLQKETIFHIETSLMLEHVDKFSTLKGVKNFAYQHQNNVGKTKLELILEDESAIADVTEIIDQNNSRILSLTKVEPTLEDVFIYLVGKGLQNEDQSKN